MQPRHPATLTQPLNCDLQPQIQETQRTTHTGTTTPCRTQRRNAFATETAAAAPAAHTRYMSSPAAATLHGKIQGFALRLPPQNKIHATFMQPLRCVLQHHVTNLHLSTHVATPDHNNHAAIPMRSATTDSTHAKNYAHRNNHSLQNTEEEHIRDRNDRSRTRRTHEVPFIAGCNHFLHGKIQGFALRLPPQNKTHATFMQPLRCVLQHHETNLHLSLRTWQHQITKIMQPFQSDPPPQIQHTQRTTHTGTTTRCRTQRRNTFATETTAAAPAVLTRYLSLPAAATLLGKIQGFVLRLPPQNRVHATSCSHHNFIECIVM